MAGGEAATLGSVVRPQQWREAVELRAQHAELVPIHGGTDVMVDVNFDRLRPTGLLDLSGVDDLDSWELVDDGGSVRIGAGVTYTRLLAELAEECPGLAAAARTIGSPQIRNRGTIAGNLATASPAGDCHPPLLAARATVEVESVDRAREIPIDDFFLGPKRSALAPDELIRAVRVPVASGPRQFAKIGPRNAMVIATVSFAISIDPVEGRVGTGIGSAGPTPLRAPEAEALVEAVVADRVLRPDTTETFGRLVAEVTSPIDDQRGTASYRRQALSVLAGRCLTWAWSELESER